MAEYKYLLGNIKGEKGDKGETGAPLRFTDLTEAQKAELKGAKGDKGDAGQDGANGNGIKSLDVGSADSEGKIPITITLDDGTKKAFYVQNGKNGADGKDGEQGATGAKGEAGADGVGIESVEQTQTGDADNDANVIVFTLTNGKKASFVVKNGSAAGGDAIKKIVIATASAGTFDTSTIGDTLTSLVKELAEETAARKEAVNTEIEDRKNEIERLTGIISSAQSTTSNSFEQKISELETQLEDTSKTLQESITNEENERAAADDDEATARNKAIADSETALKAEIKSQCDSVKQSAETQITAEQTRAKTAESDLQTQITANKSAIDTLNADEATTGSVKKSVTDAIAALIANAPESLDTLKEIADWISGHTEDAAAMNSAITANRDAIAKERADREAALKDATDKESAARLAAINEISKQLNESTDESADLDFSTTDFQM